MDEAEGWRGHWEVEEEGGFRHGKVSEGIKVLSL